MPLPGANYIKSCVCYLMTLVPLAPKLSTILAIPSSYRNLLFLIDIASVGYFLPLDFVIILAKYLSMSNESLTITVSLLVFQYSGFMKPEVELSTS